MIEQIIHAMKDILNIYTLYLMEVSFALLSNADVIIEAELNP